VPCLVVVCFYACADSQRTPCHPFQFSDFTVGATVYTIAWATGLATFCPVTTHWHTSHPPRPLAFCPVTTHHTPSTPFTHTLPLPLPLFNFSRFFAYFNFSRYFSATFTPLEPPFLPTPFFTLHYTRVLPFTCQEGPFHAFSLGEQHFTPFSLGEEGLHHISRGRSYTP
jgi:hypothetical protein